MSFTDILNTSIAASWLVLAVAAARLVLKKAPKALHCALWALVAVRLLSPVSIESAMSLIPSREVISSDYLVLEPGDREFSQPAELTIITNPVYEDRVTVEIQPTVDRVQHWDLAATIVWLTTVSQTPPIRTMTTTAFSIPPTPMPTVTEPPMTPKRAASSAL